jgi:hypothetical protein
VFLLPVCCWLLVVVVRCVVVVNTERDQVRRWSASRQHIEIAKLELLLTKQNNKEDNDDDNSFMRNSPFPYTVVLFGIGLTVLYYLLITRLPPAQKGWIPLANIGVVTVGFIFVMRSLTGD